MDLLPSEALARTIDGLRTSKTLRLAYDADAPPFSHVVPGSPPTPNRRATRWSSAEPSRQAQGAAEIPDLKVAYVPVNTTNRFEAISGNKADLLCEGATATLSRRKIVDFSPADLHRRASFVIRPDGPRDVQFLAGKKVGVLPGTTTEQELRRALTRPT